MQAILLCCGNKKCIFSKNVAAHFSVENPLIYLYTP